MGLWQDFLDCPDDQPCLVIQWGSKPDKDDEEKRELKRIRLENDKLKAMLVGEKFNQMQLENQRLRRQLEQKEMKLIR